MLQQQQFVFDFLNYCSIALFGHHCAKCIALHCIALFYIWPYTLQQQFVFDFHDFLNYCCRICGAHVSHVAHRASVSAKSAEKSQNLMLSKRTCRPALFSCLSRKAWVGHVGKFAFIRQFDSHSNSG